MTEIGEAMQGIVNYLTAFFLSLSGGVVTGPTTFQQGLTSQGNAIIQNANIVGGATVNGNLAVNGNETLGANANNYLSFASGARLSSPADGVLQMQKAAGGGTVGNTRFVLGANAPTGGASLVLNNTLQRLGFMVGDASSYVASLAQGYIYTSTTGPQLADVSGNNGIGWTSGTVTLSGGGGTPIVFTTWDPNGSAHFTSSIQVQGGGTIRSGNGAPSGTLGNVGDIYINTAGGASTTLYVKEVAGSWQPK